MLSARGFSIRTGLNSAICIIAMVSCANFASASQLCETSFQLDASFEDKNCDLLADPPVEKASFRNPETLVWAYSPIEDPTIYARLFKPFTEHLAECVGRQIVYYPVQSSNAQVAALKSGRLHFAGFSTGSTVAAVQFAGAHPFAAKGNNAGIRGYRLIAIVRASSNIDELSSLRNMRVAHTSSRSNSGNFAPRVFFPREGLVPDVDYKPIMSGGHDRSILGVLVGDYDMAAVASDVFERMAERGAIERNDFRVIFESPFFPTSSFAYAYDLDPSLVDQLKACFFNFGFTDEMRSAFHGDERFLPISYKRDWRAVREVIEASANP